MTFRIETEKHIKGRDNMNNDHALHTRRDLIVKAGLLTLSSAVAPSLASAKRIPQSAGKPGESQQDGRQSGETRPSLQFILDKNLELPTEKQPWINLLKAAGIKAYATTDLVHIDQMLADNGPDIAYMPGGDFCKLILKGNPHYQGLVIATSKFTGEPYQRTLLVVRKDDPANSIDDLAGSTYGYMNKSCSSSYFPPAVMLNRQGKNFEQFLKIVEVPGWQNRVDAVVAKKIRSTMILEDVWKMTPSNEQTCKIIGEMDHCPPSILAVNKRLDIETVGKLREQALSYIPSWQTVYGAFRPYNYADVQSFTHYLSELPADV
jgi:ABC-type phosphate/phosphonate transport system substrate-binding protein